MKTNIVAFFLFISSILAAQSSGDLRRISREVEKSLAITSDIIDGVMTYEKSKKIEADIALQGETWRKSKRSLDRVDGATEQPVLDVVLENMGEVIELTAGPLRAYLAEDPRGSYGHEYVGLVDTLVAEIYHAFDAYAAQYGLNGRPSGIQERFDQQMVLNAYTSELKEGAAAVDSIVTFLKSELGTTDLDQLFAAQKSLIKALSQHLRQYGEEAFYEGNGDLYYAYQKYYGELLELASADLLADLTKMKYDLVELRSIAASTEALAKRTLSFFDNEKRLLAKREGRFVKSNLPKAPKN
jgi:hypothetical protein